MSTTVPSEEELREYVASIREAQQGHPLRYMRNYLRIQDEHTKVIRFDPVENQLYFNALTFGVITNFDTPFEAYVLKDRKARSTTLWVLAAVAFLLTVPGFHTLIVADSDDTFRAIDLMIDLAYNNLPAWIRERLPKKHWEAATYREVEHSGKSGTASSTIHMSSSRSPHSGTGFTIKMVIFSEMGKYREPWASSLFRSVNNSLPPFAWVIKESTPEGTGNHFHSDFQAIKSGESSAIYLFRTWMHNPENRLPLNSPLARPQDKGVILTGQAGGLIGEEKEGWIAQTLRDTFGESDRQIEDRLRWRRWKISQAIRDAKGNQIAGYAAYLQEHAEDDVSVWQNFTNPQFDTQVLGRAQESVKRPVVPETQFGGLTLRIWQRSQPGHVYAAGLDFASGKSRDRTALEILDCSTGIFVAELYGKDSVRAAVKTACQVLISQYADPGRLPPMLAPEYTGLGSDAPDIARTDLGYSNVYRRPVKKSENPEGVAQFRRYGWSTDISTRSVMLTDFQADFNAGAITIWNDDLLREMSGYDPDIDDHFGDRMAAAMIAWQIREAALKRGGGSKKGFEALLGPVKKVLVIAGQRASPYGW